MLILNVKTADGNTTKIHLILGLVLGDNLGLNTIMNFSKAFSANSFCRFCKEIKSSTLKLCFENEENMRTRDNHLKDIEVNDVSVTGISENSKFNLIPSFHVIENFCVDVMHDIFEGVCYYDFSQIILYLTETMKYFDLKTLNSRKQNFNYGVYEVGNTSPDIKIQHLIKKHLKMSAREMMTFAHFFTLMVGDLVPDDDEIWQFTLCLIVIIDILLSFEITDELVHVLKHKIGKHNEDYLRLFNDTLKPKFHILVHYPRVIAMSGPLRALWSFKFEAKHRQFKLYSHAITSGKNISFTLAKKYQLKFAHYLLKNDDYCQLDTSSKHESDSTLKRVISTKLNVEENELKLFTKVKHNDICFKKDLYLAKYNVDIHFFF